MTNAPLSYDDRMADQRDRLPREDAAESRRMRREARTAFAKAARAMRRRVTVPATSPTPEIIERAGVILEPVGLFLSRAEVERMAAEVAADYCGADASRGIR